MADEKKPFQVTNTQPRVFYIAGIKIPPGATTGVDGVDHIPDHHVDGVRKSPAFRGRALVEGRVEVQKGTIKIGKLEPREAIKVVSVETDIAVLTAWADEEKRSSVLDAIRERTKQL